MKSLKHAGEIKMHGKKILVMDCGCCVCQDFRDKVAEKAANKEIQDFKRQPIDMENNHVEVD